MELTPQQLCDVEFSEQWRGYSRDQVDDFIERVAAAVADLQSRLRAMTERAVRAEQRALEGVEADGAARRTLVLAQRTADATVAEAKETAARLVAQAQEEARAIMLAAEATVEEAGATKPPRTNAEIAHLEVTRSRLHADVATLEAQLTDRRTRIKDLLDELQRRVDDGLGGHIAQWPTFDEGRVLTDPIDSTAPGVSAVSAVDLAAEPASLFVAQPAPAPAAEPDALADITTFYDEPAADPWPPLADHDAGAPSEPPAEEARDRQEDLAVPAPGYDLVRSSDHALDDDTFFAQLRGALDDEAPLGPRDHAHAPAGAFRWGDESSTAGGDASTLYDQEDSEGRRFGLRRRRQRRED
jgi:cell division initiation protein